MNSQLIKALNSHFGVENVTQLEKHGDVLLCEKKTLDGKVYQINFIDFSNKWLESDYSSYLESIVVDKFYNSESFLQWNFYYYFIASSELVSKNIERKKIIEEDEFYSRKLVLSEREFIDYINSFDKISAISKETIESDLYTNWVNFLQENNLHFVINAEKYPNYKQPVDDFINGLMPNESEEVLTSNLVGGKELVLNRINKIELLKFRKLPKKRCFNLGSVNLIQGANAAGKTSFFDAIELIITGDLYYKDVNDDYKLKLETDSGQELIYPSKATIYKNRDIQWYGSGVNRSNKLNGNFNKFNYFSSDAAFQLKQEDGNDNNNLEKIIADIALGREVNKLEERINAFKDRFNSSSENLQKELNRLNSNLKDKNDSFASLNEIQHDPKEYKTTLIEVLNKSYWKFDPNINDQAFIAKIDNEIDIISSIIDNILSKNIQVASLTKLNNLQDLSLLKDKYYNINTVKNGLITLQQERKKRLQEVEEIKVILPIIDELNFYFENDQFDNLIGNKDKIKIKTEELNFAESIKLLADSVFSKDLILKKENQAKTIIQLESELKANLNACHRSYDEAEKKISQIEEGIEDLSIILNDIKSLGLTYIKSNPEAENCPLCNTSFDFDDLKEAILNTQENFSNSLALQSLKEDINFYSKKIDELDDEQKVVKILKQLSFSVFNSNPTEKTITELRSKCALNEESIVTLTDSLIKLNTIQSKLNSSGLTEERFQELINDLNKRFSISLNSKEDLLKERDALLLKGSTFAKIIYDLDKDLVNMNLSIKANFTNDISSEDKLLSQINALEEIDGNFKQLEIYLNILPDTLLLDLIESTKIVLSVFNTFKKASIDASQNNKAAEITQNEINKILNEIEGITPKLKNARFANEVLNTLLSTQNKNNYLGRYINNNKSEIVSIFKFIHTPREFSDINFNSSKITLTTIEGDSRNLSEISTGQRSALALSIFLSLNKKLNNGPNILLFDDPVTYVDDMNVLSFFDYLRELVIKTKRQVFFATANEDLAFLFKKKFEFLSSELTINKFERDL